MNDGDEFYFYDRNSSQLTPSIKRLVDYSNAHGIKAKAGDILFFPSHMLHGVSPHRLDTPRTTISGNISVGQIGKTLYSVNSIAKKGL